MKKNLIITLFIIVAAIQIATPFSMILKRESVLKHGQSFKFKVAPVDPFDAFRGRYVAIRIEGDKIPLRGRKDFEYGQKAYALIKTNQDGFSSFVDITKVRPQNEPYMEVILGYTSKENIELEFPIDRYYMEEKAAPKAERLYQQHTRRSNDKRDAYIQIKIKDGFPVIEQLYVGGMRIEDAVKKMKQK